MSYERLHSISIFIDNTSDTVACRECSDIPPGNDVLAIDLF